jgi:hypothetical protein
LRNIALAITNTETNILMMPAVEFHGQMRSDLSDGVKVNKHLRWRRRVVVVVDVVRVWTMKMKIKRKLLHFFRGIDFLVGFIVYV